MHQNRLYKLLYRRKPLKDQETVKPTDQDRKSKKTGTERKLLTKPDKLHDLQKAIAKQLYHKQT